MLFISYKEALDTAICILKKAGCSDSQAAKLADVFVTNSLEGVASHGLNRFPRFIGNIYSGEVDIHAEPEKISGFGGLEVWDGHIAPGATNAELAMNRAIELAKEHGIGCVSMRNTNHWIRAGRYGWQAANAGMIGILWTNTCPNMPAWGAKDARIGNNPIVFAIPRKNGHIIADIAMSQFAYGKLEVSAQKGEKMPIYAGFDLDGNYTNDPKKVIESNRTLPIGYWKGAAMSMVLDLMTAAISLGKTTAAIGKANIGEFGLSQTFIAINYRAVVDEKQADEILNESIEFTKASIPADGTHSIRYPGENIASIRAKNLENGIPVTEETWNKILSLKVSGK